MLTTFPIVQVYVRVSTTLPLLRAFPAVEDGMRRRRGAGELLRAALLAALLLALLAVPAAAAPLDRAFASQLARAGAAGAYVLDTSTGRTLAAVRADVPRNPASVEKLYTTSTALLRFGPAATLQTTVLGTGALDAASGTWQGDLYLRGGGDPTFGTAGLAQLATALRAGGIAHVTGSVFGDESLLDALRGDPATGFGLDREELGGPLSGLLYNRGIDGRGVQARPATFVAQQLRAALGHRGVAVEGPAGEAPTPPGAQQLAVLPSPTIATLVQLTLPPSDNLYAEMLLKDLGASFGGTGSTAAGAAVVRQTILRFHVRPAIVDGSGLSRSDRTTPHQVVALLAGMRGNPALAAALPIPGRSGTLIRRMRGTAAARRCEAKTGTLSNASALAGYCRTANGHLLAFAFIENHVPPLRAKAIEDRLTVALASTRPAGTAPVTPPTVPVGGAGGAPAGG
jgi:D-alanyl-D-alanine carboxypeptidase/D-alanyl-D-alanine-endopeptidase (penicillin-binding protein 4)